MKKMIAVKKILLIWLLTFLLSACVVVKPWEREKLGDPIMEPKSQFAKQKLDAKFFSSREGSMGGTDGIGGGCGCAK